MAYPPNSNAPRSAIPPRRGNRGDYHRVANWTTPAEDERVRQGDTDRQPLRTDAAIAAQELGYELPAGGAGAVRKIRIAGAEGETQRPVRVPRKGAAFYGENGAGFSPVQENPQRNGEGPVSGWEIRRALESGRLSDFFRLIGLDPDNPTRPLRKAPKEKPKDFFNEDWNNYREKRL